MDHRLMTIGVVLAAACCCDSLISVTARADGGFKAPRLEENYRGPREGETEEEARERRFMSLLQDIQGQNFLELDSPDQVVLVAFDADCLRTSEVHFSKSWEVCGASRTAPDVVVGSQKGSGWLRLDPASTEKIAKLLRRAENQSLRNSMPPHERRLVLGKPADQGMEMFLFDRAQLPAEILEGLRLAKIRPWFGAWTLPFKPADTLTVTEGSQFLNLAASTDGTRLYFGPQKNTLHVVDGIARKLMGQVPLGTTHGFRSFSIRADGGLLGAAGYAPLYIDVDQARTSRIVPLPNSPRDDRRLAFTGDYLLVGGVYSNELAVYTSSNVQPASVPDYLPPELRWFQLGPGNRRALIWRQDGSLSLWNCETRKDAVTIEPNCGAFVAEFSLDEKRVAVLSVTPGRTRPEVIPHLRVYDADTAKLQCEFWPHDVGWRDERGKFLQWTRDGGYLLGIDYPDELPRPIQISLWNINQGRLRASLIGHGHRVVGMAVVRGGRELVAGFDDGSISWWDLESIVDEVRRLEVSLENANHEE